MTRTCRHSTCTRSATATLTFRYATAQAWLGDLAREAEPQCWDLCPMHASSLTVPRGWELVDGRTEPGADTQEALRREPVAAGATRHNRYAELSALLPQLAREVTASSPLLGESPDDTDRRGES